MNYLLLFFIMLAGSTTFAQPGKFNLIIEYSPNYSKISGGLSIEQFKWSHNVFVKTAFPKENNVNITAGFGFFSTGDAQVSDLMGFEQLNKLKINYNNHFILMPFGLKIKSGSLFINPEIAIGINTSNTVRTIKYYTDGHKESETRDDQLFNGSYKKVTVPVLLSSGYTFKIYNINMYLGLKGYYSITTLWKGVNRKGHYYGAGIMTGIVF